MALGEELSKLDSAVAAGHITAEQFRSRRDQLLASAGSGPAANDPTAGGPFPPPYRWGDSPDGEPAERTQVVARAASSDRAQVVPRTPPAPESADRTQVVPRTPAAPPSAPTHPTADAERTQVVRGGQRPSGYATVGAPPWARGSALTAAAQAGPSFQRPEATLPPWTLGQPEPTGQPPSQYAEAADFRRGARSRWLLPVAAVVVLAVIIGLLLYFLR